jgi:hypothetical protein
LYKNDRTCRGILDGSRTHKGKGADLKAVADRLEAEMKSADAGQAA